MAPTICFGSWKHEGRLQYRRSWVILPQRNQASWSPNLSRLDSQCPPVLCSFPCWLPWVCTFDSRKRAVLHGRLYPVSSHSHSLRRQEFPTTKGSSVYRRPRTPWRSWSWWGQHTNQHRQPSTLPTHHFSIRSSILLLPLTRWTAWTGC